MPTPKRWHPISRDLNHDSEVWQLTDLFGDRAIRILIEVLSAIDRTENEWRLVGPWLQGLSRVVRQQPSRVLRVMEWMLTKGWFVANRRADPGALYDKSRPGQGIVPVNPSAVLGDGKGDCTIILSASNYLKYHKMREPSGAKLGPDKEHKRSPDRVPPYANLPYPNLREERRVPVDTVNSGDKENRIVSTVGSTSKPDEPMTRFADTLKSLSPSLGEIFSEHMKENP